MGNFLATIIGAIFGIPIALMIDRYQQKEKQDDELMNAEAKRKELEERVINLLAKELVQNRNIIQILVLDQEKDPLVLETSGLTNDLWNALSEGGVLGVIKDIILLDKLSSAYFLINRLIFLENQFYNPLFSLEMMKNERKTIAGERALNTAHKLRPDAIDAIQKALTYIKDNYKSIEIIEPKVVITKLK